VTRSGGQILVDQLELHEAELAFGVPGESYIDVLDALRDSTVRFVTCRHEAGAANMAEAYGKLTNRPGLCLVTRGPGAMQAAVGVHTASQDGTPFILLVGQIPRADVEREAFQELDYRRVFSSFAKWVAQIDQVERIPELLARAFRVATSGRPGPVVLALPEDVLSELADVRDASPSTPAQAAPGDAELASLHVLLERAERPLVVVGGQPWTGEAGASLARWCEASEVPVAAAWRSQDYVSNDSGCYVGHLGLGADPSLRDRLRDADLLLVVGARLGDIETGGFATIVPPGDGRTLVHVHPDPNELGRVYEPALGIVASGPRFASALERLEPLAGGGRGAELAAARSAYLDTLEGRSLPGAVQLTEVMAILRDRLGHEAILTSGAGNFTIWAHRFYVFRSYRTQLAPLSGAMGYGLPAAIAAKLVHPPSWGGGVGSARRVAIARFLLLNSNVCGTIPDGRASGISTHGRSQPLCPMVQRAQCTGGGQGHDCHHAHRSGTHGQPQRRRRRGRRIQDRFRPRLPRLLRQRRRPPCHPARRRHENTPEAGYQSRPGPLAGLQTQKIGEHLGTDQRLQDNRQGTRSA
jgi:acetolactate synthase-1/2/3 large subunit